MPAPSRRSRGRFARTKPLTVFLVATLALAAWLGYQAIDAAASHRRTAEAVLEDYALISATQLAQVARGNLGEVLDEIFSPVSRRLRGPALPSPEVVRWNLSDAMRGQRCRCEAFRDPLALFRVRFASGAIEVVPDTLDAAARERILALVSAGGVEGGRRYSRIVTSEAGVFGTRSTALGFMISEDVDGTPEAAFGFLVDASGLEDLFRRWYERRQLLPQPIAGDQPNDSLLFVRVEGTGGVPIFSSPVAYPPTLGASSPVGPRFDDLVVHAAVRPDAASQLIIGGLPNSRLPLLAALLVLTVGVGLAAVVQLRREQEFQRLREDFVSGVSHELRTPLAQIRMFSELQESGRLPSEEDRARAVSVIHREARHLTHLVENILQFSRLRRIEGPSLPMEPVALEDAVRDGVAALTPLARDRGMDLCVRADGRTIVMANRDAVGRIVVNLLDNAMKYGPPGQAIEVVAEPVDGAARITVSDDGPGIPPADHARVWKAYQRLDRDVRARVPGTGIGLSVVQQLAELHGGQVRIEEANGGGARFVVTLPLAEAHDGVAPVDGLPGGNGRREA